MFCPKPHIQADQNQCFELINHYPLATLITEHDGVLEADHIPLLVSEQDEHPTLIGHIAAQNPLVRQLEKNPRALLVFQGAQTYISPNYYASKQQDPKVVPTWNYCVVHIQAKITLHHDKAWKLDMLHRMTNRYESAQAKPWSVDDAPAAFTDKLLPAIVGIKCRTLNMSGKWKASQNQPIQNQQSVVDALASGSENDQKMAAIVQRESVKTVK